MRDSLDEALLRQMEKSILLDTVYDERRISEEAAGAGGNAGAFERTLRRGALCHPARARCGHAGCGVLSQNRRNRQDL